MAYQCENWSKHIAKEQLDGNEEEGEKENRRKKCEGNGH
jgi:hypothetical protein